MDMNKYIPLTPTVEVLMYLDNL